DRAERGADDDTDRHVDDVALDCEFLELLHNTHVPPPGSGIEQLERRPVAARELIERALLRRLVGSPALERRAVSESTLGKMVVADLYHQSRAERHPLGGPLGAPSAGSARSASREAGRLPQRFQLACQCLTIVARNVGGEADVVEQAVLVVEPQEQAADRLRLRPVAKPATTQSTVRIRLIFCIVVRAPLAYGASSSFATTPSRPVRPSFSHCSARSRSVVCGERCVPLPAPRYRPAKDSRRARRSRNGSSSSASPRSARSRSNATKIAGCSVASLLTRLAAGWMR